MIGAMLGDRYEILEKVGEGGMAVVYKAKCHLLNRNVAVKVLKDEFADDEEFVEKFRRESQAAASLNHPNILNVYDVGMDEVEGKKVHYIVMEFIDGETLKDYINKKGKLSEDETIDMSIQIAEAVKEAHDNKIIHRDIKPQNIMITENYRVKVTDFGIARAATSATVTVTSKALGSVHYISPEQARGGYVDEKSDIYSLGIVMYEMATGELPFSGDTPIAIALKHIQEEVPSPRVKNPNISDGLNKIILSCSAKQQADRYSSIDDVISDLVSLKTGNIVSGHTKVKNTVEKDEFATQVIPKVEEKSLKERSEQNMNKKKPKKNKNNGSFKTTIMAVLLAFIVVSASFFFIMKFKLAGSKNNDEIAIPNFVGMHIDKAEKLAMDNKIEIQIKDTVNEAEYFDGEIIRQLTEEGMKVKEGFVLEVVVNKQAEMLKVPNVSGKSLVEAEQLIRDSGLVSEIIYSPSDNVEKDYIIEQKPEAYTFVDPEAVIKLVVSEGITEEEKVIMPKVTDMSADEARETLRNLGLEVEVMEEYSDDFDAGKIMWQSYKAGVELEKGKKVQIYISKGPEENQTNEIPNTGNTNNTEGSSEKNFNIPVTPFTDREETVIVINKKQDGQVVQVYNKTHKSVEGEIVVPVRGKPGAEFEVLFDDIYQFTRVVE